MALGHAASEAGGRRRSCKAAETPALACGSASSLSCLKGKRVSILSKLERAPSASGAETKTALAVRQQSLRDRRDLLE